MRVCNALRQARDSMRAPDAKESKPRLPDDQPGGSKTECTNKGRDIRRNETLIEPEIDNLVASSLP